MLISTIINTMPPFLRSRIARVESSPLGKRLAKGAFWSLLGALASRGLNMAAMMILARILGKNEFGEIGVIQSTMGMVQTLAGFGLGWAATKYVAEFRNSDPAKAGRIISFSNLAAIGTGGLMALIFFLAAPWLAANSLSAPQLSIPLQISSLILLFGTLVGTQNGILAGFESFRLLARIGVVSGIVSLPLIVGGAWIAGVEGAVWGLIAANLVNWVLNYRCLRAEAFRAGVLMSRKGCWQERALLWEFGLPTILGGTALNGATWIGTVMLVNRPGGYGEMGFYNAANQWFSALLFLPGVIGQAAIPVLSEQIGNRDHDRSKKVLVNSIKLNMVIIFPVAIIGSLCSPWIMTLYGKDFEAAWPTLVVTLIAAAITAVQSPAAQVLTSSGNMWKAAIMNVSWALSFIILSKLLLSWGSLGLGTARSVAYLVYSLWSIRFALKLIDRLKNQVMNEVNSEETCLEH